MLEENPSKVLPQDPDILVWGTRAEWGAALGSWGLSLQAEAALQPAPSPGLASCSRPVWDAEKKINHWGMGKLIKFQSNHFLYII